MPTILQTVQGRVTGLWGAALIRGADGKMRALKMGDLVHRGDVILTTQDGIVQLTPEKALEAAQAPSDDMDRVIADIENNEPTAATAAIAAGDGGGGLSPGLRVDRVAESISSGGSLQAVAQVQPHEAFAPSNEITAAQDDGSGTTEPAPGTGEPAAPALVAASTSIDALEEGPSVGLGIAPPSGASATAVITVDQVPLTGQLSKADGSPVGPGSTLTSAELAGLRYVPPADYDGSTPVGGFAYTVNDGGTSASGGTRINLAAVNDAPAASTASATGIEDSTLPIALGGTDVDSAIAGVTVTGIPANGALLLADGVTPVLAGQTLTAAQAATLLFRPAADFNGSTAFEFTVTDDAGTVSAPASASILLTAVNDAPIAAADTAGGLEDKRIDGNVLANDTDVDGPTLSLTQFSVGAATFPAGSTAILAGVGTLQMLANGDYAFIPAPNYNGAPPVVTYAVADGSSTSSSTLALTVTPVEDAVTISLSASAAAVSEGGSIVYTASLDNAVAGSPLIIALSNGQSITIPVGATSASSAPFAVRADDAFVQGADTLTVGIAGTSGGAYDRIDSVSTATATVTDDADTTTVSLSATPGVAEGGVIVYTASLSAAAQSPVSVTLSNGAVVAIATGTSTGTVSVPAPGDDTIIDAGSVSATIVSAAGGTFESLAVNPAAAVTAIADTIDTTTVSLTATSSVAEGGAIIYTASLTSAAQTPVSVTLSNGAVIAIAAGANTGMVSVPAPADDAVIDAGNVSATIASATGGNFESLSIDPAAAITSVSDTIDTTTVSLTATPSVAEGGSIIYTASLTSVAQTAVSVTLSNGAVIGIAAGASTGTVSVPAPSDDVHADAGSVSATIASATGGNFESLVVNPAAAVTAISDTIDTTTVSLTATASVAEGGSIVYTASLTAAAQSPVSVTLSNGAVITVVAGASTGTVSMPAPSDDVHVDAGSVSATIASATGGNFESLVVNPAPAVTAISDTIDTTTVSLTATANVAEGGSIVYTASLTAAAQSPVSVTLSNGAVIGIAAGASTGTVSVPAPGDDVYLDAASVSATIASATGGNFEALAIDPAAAVTSISDTIDTTTVSLTATPSVNEGGSIVYTASLTAVAQTSVAVTLSNGGTITIAAGASTGTVSVPAPADDSFVDAATVSATITSATGGNFESLAINPAAALTSVTDTIDTTTVSLTAAANVAEGGSIVYTASVDNAVTGSALTVNLSNGQSIVIPVGATSASSAVFAVRPDDLYLQGSQSLTVGIDSTSGGNFESLDTSAQAVTVVTDDADAATVSLAATGSVVDGGSIVYTATLTAPAQTPVDVTLSNGATIQIAAGAASGSTSVTAPAGSTAVSATIVSATGGNFETLLVDPSPADTIVHQAPEAVADTASATEAAGIANGTPGVDPSGNVLDNDTDANAGDTKAVSAIGFGAVNGTVGAPLAGAYGTLTLAADGSYSYQVNNANTSVQALRNPSDTLTEVFSYTVTDSSGLSSSTTLTVTIHGANDAPVATVDVGSTLEDNFTSGNVLANDSDVDAGTTLTVTQFTIAGVGGSFAAGATASMAGVGTLTMAANGNYVFVPVANFNGAVPTVTYTVSDGALTSTSTLTISVTPVNDGPALDLDNNNSTASGTGYAATYTENGAPVAIGDVDVRITDPDSTTMQGATVTLTNMQAGDVLAVGSLPPGITATINSANSISLSGAASLASYEAAIRAITFANTSDSPNTTPRTIQVTVTDGALGSNLATATINVVAVNDAPVIGADSATTNEDTPLTIAPATLLANDSDAENDPLSFVSVQGAVNGSVAMSGGNIVFTPQANYSGPASFTYTVSDGQGGTSTGTVNVDVVAVADTPALSAPTHLYSLNAGSASISTASGTNQNNIEAALGLPAGTLDDFDPPAGSTTSDPGTVNVNNGRYTSYSLSLEAGSQANFNWQFFNGEDMASEINSGFNDMLILAITDPAGVQQFVQVTSSEQAGPNTNGGTVDASGIYSFAAASAGQYTFHWIVANGGDATKNSSATIASPTVTMGASAHGAPIAFPINTGPTDADGSETLSVSVSGVPAGAAFSAGTDQGGGIWTFAAAELGGLQLLPAAGFTGTLNLTVTGSSTETSNGATASTSQSVTIQVGTTTASQMGTQSAETLNGTSGSDVLRGYGGNDTLNGSGGNDLLYGDAGNDTLNGGNGNDILFGGSGNDTLTGGNGADVFAWTLADKGAAGSPAVDIITDFNNATAASGGDQLDLRDLLQGENLGGGAGNLGNYLHFSLSGGNTTISISANGGFSGGYSASAVDQTIVLQSVDLTSGGAMTDQQIIQDLLQKSKLVVDAGP